MTVKEKEREVSGDAQSATVGFWITGQNAWADAYNELYAASVGGGSFASFNGIPAQRVMVDEVSESRGYFNGTVEYGYDTPRATVPNTSNLELTYSFETSVRPKLERFLSDGPGWTKIGTPVAATGYEPADHDGLGYQGPERGYEGIEVPRPETSFNLEYTPVSAPNSFFQKVSNAVGTVNSDPFHIYAAGEVIFAGARGQSKLNDRWRFSYQFLVKENRTSVDCGNGVVIAAADGWDVIEVEYIRTTRTLPTKRIMTLRTKQARVLRPYARKDFNTELFV